MLYVFGYGKNWWKSDGKLLITYVSTKEKEKRHKSKFYCEKKEKSKEECKVKKCIMKVVVAMIKMKEMGQKDVTCPSYVL